jgi:hypothetical protein
MCTRTTTIVTVLAVLSLVSGAVGCRSNGSGPWYQPNSYTWGNPFKTAENSTAPRHDYQQADNTKPSLGAQPSVTAPPSGYTSKESEDARFHPNTTQNTYGISANQESSMVASAQSPAPSYGSGYSAADSASYRPSYGSGDLTQNTAQNNTPNYQYQGSAAQPSVYPPASNYQETSATTYPTTPSYSNQPYGNNAVTQTAAQTPAAPQGNYAPFGTPAQETNPLYGNQSSPTTGYGAQPQSTSVYGNQSATPAPYGTTEPAAGTPNYSYTTAPSSVPPQNNNGFGY